MTSYVFTRIVIKEDECCEYCGLRAVAGVGWVVCVFSTGCTVENVGAGDDIWLHNVATNH